ncbi:MAG: MBL fold metallo-hydrolase [Acidobacteriota bacterium]|nr:MBL fold metallo-hydrolase [Acidobacteriota bacterium]
MQVSQMPKWILGQWLLGRRCLAAAALFAMCGLPIFAQANPEKQPPLPIQIVKIKENVYTLEGQGGNSTVVLTSAGVILVDCKFERNHDEVVEKVKSLSDKPIRYLFATHSHADHSGGSAKMAAMGVAVISSVNTRENMVRTNQAPGPEVLFEGEMQLNLGGTVALARQFRGHTNGDVVVFFPAARVVAMGDLMTTGVPGMASYADGGNWTDFGKALDEIVKLDFDFAVPGHGPVATKADVLAYRDKLAAMRARIQELVRAQKTQDEIAAILIKEFQWGAPASRTLPSVMQELH